MIWTSNKLIFLRPQMAYLGRSKMKCHQLVVLVLESALSSRIKGAQYFMLESHKRSHN